MQLNGVASAIIVVSFLIMSLVSAGLLAAIAVLLARVNAVLEATLAKASPTLDSVDLALVKVTEQVETIGERATGILTHGEAMTETLQGRVDQTTGVVQRVVNAPLIGVNSVVAGVTKGVATFQRLQRSPLSSTEQYSANSAAANAAERVAIATGNN